MIISKNKIDDARSFRSRRASAQPTAGRPKAGRPEAARGRLRGAGDRRNDGGIDGRRRLTVASPTASTKPIDKAAGNALIACDRVERIWRHQCTQVLEEVGSRVRRSRCGGSRWRRSRWDAKRPMGGLEPSGLRGGWWRARRGCAPEQGRCPISGAGRARDSQQRTADSRADQAGLSRTPRSGAGQAGAKEREAGDVTRTTRFSGQRKRKAHIKPEPQGHAGNGA